MLESIISALGLGTPTRDIQRLSGGFLHKMYDVQTESGRYAVKLLNPAIMQRPDAPGNYQRAEKIEDLLEESNLPILPALRINGQKLHCVDGQYVQCYPFFEGKALSPAAVTPAHSAKIGAALARLHAVDRRVDGFEPAEMSIDWESSLPALTSTDTECAFLLTNALPLLKHTQERRNRAIHRIPRVLSICHNDMDVKNVLWNGEDFRIIDLECLGYASPMLEFMELALCWSGAECDTIRPENLLSFARAYKEAGGEMPTDYESLFDANWDRPYWLEYNVQRALSSDPEERTVGLSEVKNTIDYIARLESQRGTVFKILAAL